MEKEKRKPRAYKITDKRYNKAMRRAKKDKKSLATLIEEWVIIYGEGFSMAYTAGDFETRQSNKK